MASLTQKINNFANSVVKAATKVKNSIVNFFSELRDKGVKKSVENIKTAFKNTVTYLKSGDNFKLIIKSIKERLNL